MLTYYVRAFTSEVLYQRREQRCGTLTQTVKHDVEPHRVRFHLPRLCQGRGDFRTRRHGAAAVAKAPQHNPGQGCAPPAHIDSLVDFPGAVCDKSKTQGTGAGGGMSTAWPFHGERSNSSTV
jgi:hypothetical protein